LQQLGVQVGQGWLFAKALPKAEDTNPDLAVAALARLSAARCLTENARGEGYYRPRLSPRQTANEGHLTSCEELNEEEQCGR
jgi:hypothetical protein